MFFRGWVCSAVTSGCLAVTLFLLPLGQIRHVGLIRVAKESVTRAINRTKDSRALVCGLCKLVFSTRSIKYPTISPCVFSTRTTVFYASSSVPSVRACSWQGPLSLLQVWKFISPCVFSTRYINLHLCLLQARVLISPWQCVTFRQAPLCLQNCVQRRVRGFLVSLFHKLLL